MPSQRTLDQGQDHLFCDDKTSGLRKWLIEVWMSAGTGRGIISRVSSDTEKQKEVLQKTLFFCVLEINWLASSDTHFSYLKQLAVSLPDLAWY